MQPFHLAAYLENVAAVTNSDINAVPDDVFQVRNSHLIISEPINLIARFAMGSSLTRARFGNVALTYRGIPHFFPPIDSATVPTRPEIENLIRSPIKLPLNEEITIEATTTAAGPQDVQFPLWLARPEWQPLEPNGEEIGWVRATVVIAAGAEAAWSNPVAITLERDLYNGVYAVVGAHVIAANAVAFRMDFRTQPCVGGRKFRPGGLVMNAIGDVPSHLQGYGLGEWGRFSTFELPSIQTLDDSAGGTYEVRLRLKYLGADLSLLQA